MSKTNKANTLLPMRFVVALGVLFSGASPVACPGEVTVTKKDPTKDVSLETGKKEDENKVRSVTVNLQKGYVITKTPTIGSDPGSLWTLTKGGKAGDTSAEFKGFQVKDAENPKIYTPRFMGDAKPIHRGGGGKGDGGEMVDKGFDWSVSGKYGVANCVLEYKFVPYEREFPQTPQYDDELEFLNPPEKIAVTLGGVTGVSQVRAVISDTVTPIKKKITKQDGGALGFFFSEAEMYVVGGKSEEKEIEKCKNCGGDIHEIIYYVDFDVRLDNARAYIPYWKDKPLEMSKDNENDDVWFYLVDLHERKHQEDYMRVYRNPMVRLGKKMASTYLELKVCVSKKYDYHPMMCAADLILDLANTYKEHEKTARNERVEKRNEFHIKENELLKRYFPHLENHNID